MSNRDFTLTDLSKTKSFRRIRQRMSRKMQDTELVVIATDLWWSKSRERYKWRLMIEENVARLAGLEQGDRINVAFRLDQRTLTVMADDNGLKLLRLWPSSRYLVTSTSYMPGMPTVPGSAPCGKPRITHGSITVGLPECASFTRNMRAEVGVEKAANWAIQEVLNA